MAVASVALLAAACGRGDDRQAETAVATSVTSPAARSAAQLAALPPLQCDQPDQPPRGAADTPTPAATAAATGTPKAEASPAPTPRPAPQVDRVGFPEGYSDSFRLLFAYDRPDNRQVRVICGNDAAASWAEGGPFPYGSILVMETYRAKIGTDGKPALDGRGRYVRESLMGVFIMRKEPGFDEDYGPLPNGEWEYVAFRPDGKTYSSPPSATANCASCHLALKETPDADWVFRTNLIAADDKLTSGKAPTQGPHDVLELDGLRAQHTHDPGRR